MVYKKVTTTDFRSFSGGLKGEGRRLFSPLFYTDFHGSTGIGTFRSVQFPSQTRFQKKKTTKKKKDPQVPPGPAVPKKSGNVVSVLAGSKPPHWKADRIFNLWESVRFELSGPEGNDGVSYHSTILPGIAKGMLHNWIYMAPPSRPEGRRSR